jgi:tetratricopeptide (TPR) repeat protein
MNLTPEQLKQFANDELSPEEFQRIAQQLRSLSPGALQQMFVQGGIKIEGSGIVIGHGSSSLSLNLSGEGAKALVDLHRELLERDRALHQLPSPPPDFTGRGAELEELLTASNSGGVVISGIQGMGGIGKTVLALKLAEQIKDRYPDAQFFLNLEGASANPMASRDAMAHVIRGYEPLYQMPEHDAEVRGKYLSVLHNQRALLVLDNAASEEQVAPLLPPASCALLVTSRQHFVLEGMQAKRLDAMTRPDACDLLMRIAPRIGAHADNLAKLCGDLPLALRLVASALQVKRNLKPEAYAERLQRTGLQLLDKVEAAFQLSYDLLQPEQQRLWCRLSVMRGTFDDAAAAAVWKLAEEEATDKLGDLLAYSLVEWNDETSRYHLHDLTRLFAAARLNDEERLMAERQHATHYKAVLAAADELYLQGHHGVYEGLALYEQEASQIAAGQAWAAAWMGEEEAAAQLCMAYPDAGVYVLGLRQHPRARIAWLDAMLLAAQRLQKRSTEGYALGNLGNAYAFLGELRRAITIYEERLQISREIRDRRGEGAVLGNLGNAYKDLGDVRRAIVYQEQYLQIAREVGDLRYESQALSNLGNAYSDLDETHKAIGYYEQNLQIARKIGDRMGEGYALGNLGISYARLGDVRQAIGYFEQVLQISRELGDRKGEGTSLCNLGAAYADLGETRNAIGYYEQNLQIVRELGDRKGEGDMLGRLGSGFTKLGEVQRAIGYCEQHLQISREIGDRRGEGIALGRLGIAYEALGKVQQAIVYQEKHLQISREIEDRSGVGMALGNLGNAYAALGEVERAIAYYEQRLQIAREIKDYRGESAGLGNLGNVYRDLGDVQRAITYYEQVLQIAHATEDRLTEGTARWNLALTWEMLGDNAQAIAGAEAALLLYEQIESPQAAMVRQRLAEWR